MEKPEFELGDTVLDLTDIIPLFQYQIVGIVMHDCPCGCNHRWFEYQLSKNASRTKQLLVKVED